MVSQLNFACHLNQFYKCSQYHKHLYTQGWRVEPQGLTNPPSKLKTANISWCHCQLHIYHTKQLNPWPTSPAKTHGELQLATCLFREDGAILSPLEYSWASDIPQKQVTVKQPIVELHRFQHQYLLELLVNMYSYCVRGSRLIAIQLAICVTYV